MDRVIFSVTAEVPGTRIAFLRFEFDTADEQTARYVGGLAPARLPATGNGGLADKGPGGR